MTSPTPTQQHIDYWLKRQREQQASDQSLVDEARMLLNQIVSLLTLTWLWKAWTGGDILRHWPRRRDWLSAGLI